MAQITIQHTSGSKVNQTQRFPLDAAREITFGRDSDRDVAFDPQREDMVSRRHATLRAGAGDKPSFTLVDSSSNGTFVNGARMTGEKELIPGDTIAFGPSGPSIVFDVEPRPAHLIGATRMMQTPAAPPGATRMSSAASPLAAPPTGPAMVPVKAGVGHETVQRLLSEHGKATSRTWMYVLAGVLLLVGAGGGGLYYTSTQANRRQAETLAKAQAALSASIKNESESVRAKMGVTAEDIAHKYGNATVQIFLEWRAIDKDTGKPVYHKMASVDGTLVPCYVAVPGGAIVRWLTSEDQDHNNRLVGGEGSGSGFVISPNGFIMTNKHVAAGWTVPYFNYSSEYETGRALLFQMGDRKRRYEVVDLTSSEAGIKALKWIPEEEGGVIFDPRVPNPLAARKNLITGQNVQLNVRFPGNPSAIEAKLVSSAEGADAAEIKIDTGQNLTTVVMAPDDNVRVGQRVTVLGFPGFSTEIHALRTSIEAGNVQTHNDVVPEPTVTEGLISLLSPPPKQVGAVTTVGDMGDVYQLTVPTSHGNSGGPVFDSHGNVIALFTYGKVGRETTTYAVPIRYARDLMQMQREN